MILEKKQLQKLLALIGAFLCFFAVFSQFIIRLLNLDIPWYVLTINHFSYFTILTNLLVGVFFIAQLVNEHNKFRMFFSSTKTTIAICVYIFLVGLIFNLMLRKIYHPSGWEGVNNNLLHVFIPIFMIVYAWYFTSKEKLAYLNIAYWTIYPTVYVVYLLVKGYFMHFYQYPFFNLDELGYEKVLIQAVILLIVLVILSFAFIFINNKRIK